jgi:hypothetical protein
MHLHTRISNEVFQNGNDVPAGRTLSQMSTDRDKTEAPSIGNWNTAMQTSLHWAKIMCWFVQ